MKRFLFLATLCVAFAGAISPAADKSSDQAKKKQPATRPVAVNKICPVDGHNAVVPSVTTIIYNDQVIGFCCEDCIPKFWEHPDYYMQNLK